MNRDWRRLSERHDAEQRQQQLTEIWQKLWKIKKQYKESVKKDQTGQFNYFMDKLSRGSILDVWRGVKPMLKKRTQGQVVIKEQDLERFK